ncbi:hypothetical protein O0L34_g10217 [Tuta absoluta]|nr:hypothetical protein O0L34_g10217 [Tuta absoluta]
MELNKEILKILQQEDPPDLNVTTTSPNSNTVSYDYILDDLPTWNESEAQISGRRIYNGKRTKIKDFPFMASVQIFGKFQCGGSIIKADLVLTAASCLQLAYNNRFYRENPLFLSVRVGSSFYEVGGESIDVMEVYFHPGYNPKNLNHNVAVMRLIRKIKLKKNKSVKKIRLDTEDHRLASNAGRVQLVGWGAKTRANILHSPFDNKLSFSTLNLYAHEDCKDVYSKEYVTHRHFCAGSISTGSGACNRDVGDPGIIGGKLMGIVSFGSPACGTPDAPTVFTKVGFYNDWIEEIMEQHVPVIKGHTTELPPTYPYEPPSPPDFTEYTIMLVQPATTAIDINIIEEALKPAIQSAVIESTIQNNEAALEYEYKYKKVKHLREEGTKKIPSGNELEAKDKELFKNFLKTMFNSGEAEKYADKITNTGKGLGQNAELQQLMLRLLKNGEMKQKARYEPTVPDVPDPQVTAIIEDETPSLNENASFESDIEIKNIRTTKIIPFDTTDNDNEEDDVTNPTEPDSEMEEDKVTSVTKQTKKQTDDNPDSGMIDYLATMSMAPDLIMSKHLSTTTAMSDLTKKKKLRATSEMPDLEKAQPIRTTSVKPDFEMAESLVTSYERQNLELAELMNTTSVKPDLEIAGLLVTSSEKQNLELADLMNTTSVKPHFKMSEFLVTSSEMLDLKIVLLKNTTSEMPDLATKEGLLTTSALPAIPDLVLETGSTSEEEVEKKDRSVVGTKQEKVKTDEPYINIEAILDQSIPYVPFPLVKTKKQSKNNKLTKRPKKNPKLANINNTKDEAIDKMDEKKTKPQNNFTSEKKMRSVSSEDLITNNQLAELSNLMDNDFLMEILNEEFVNDIKSKASSKTKPKRKF